MIKKILQIMVIGIFTLNFSNCVCRRGGDEGQQDGNITKDEIDLKVWNLFDNEEIFTPIIQKYNEKHSNIHIKYQKKELTEYEDLLINAIAGGEGPDIFVIRNDWFPKHKDKLAASPSDFVTAKEVEDNFAPVVKKDFVKDNQVWALPIFIDSLALYYNIDMLDEAALQPPNTWNDFVEAVKKLTKKDGPNITQAGVAMGTSANTEFASDILMLLMIQSLKQYKFDMTSQDNKSATFHLPTKKESGEQTYPGTEALNFYTSFARPTKETYAWNKDLPISYKAFLEKKAAMMINYQFRVKYLRDQNPTLSFDVVPIPQIKGSEENINYGNYWSFAVSKKTTHINEAWDFIKFITSSDMQRIYNLGTNKPFSNKTLADEYKESTYFGAFNAQVNTVQSWYKSKSVEKIEPIFKEMIDNVVVKNTPIQAAIDKAAADVIKLLQND